MQESSETRDLEKLTRLAYSVSFALNSFQTTNQTENNNERSVHDNNSPFTAYANIPDEIALFIFEYLDFENLFTSSCVNKKWLQLASDKNILNKFIQKYTHGNLWTYLSKKPEISSYQAYFREVFGIQIDTTDFFTKNTFLTFSNHFFIEDRRLYQKELKVQKDFVKYISGFNEDKLLLQGISDAKEILSILHTAKESNLSLAQCKKAVSLLIRIKNLDILITDYLYVANYAANKTQSMAWLDDPQKNLLLSGNALVALTTLDHKLIYHIFNDPKLGHLVNRLSEEQIVQIVEIAPFATEIFCWDPHIASKVSSEMLIYLTKALPYLVLREPFYHLIETSSIYYSRWSGNLLVELGKERKPFSYLILNHPKLSMLLTEDQFIALSLNLIPSEVTTLLNSEVFWNFKVKNRRQFLLRFQYLEDVIGHTRAAAFFLPEDFLPLTQHNLVIALALAQQEIFLKKLNEDQLLELALYHPEVTHKMLSNKNIIHRWSNYSLKKIEQNSKCYSEEVKTALQTIRQYQFEERRKLTLIKKVEIRSLPYEPSPPKSIMANVEIKSNHFVRKAIPPFRSFSSLSKQKNRLKVELGVLIAALLITILTAALFATGIGGLLGVGFMVTALTALSFTHMSVSTLAITCLVTSVLTTLITVPLILAKIKNKLKNFLTAKLNPEPEEKHFSRSSSYLDFFKNSLVKNHRPASKEDLSNTKVIITEVYPPLFSSPNTQNTTVIQEEKIISPTHESNKTISF